MSNELQLIITIAGGVLAVAGTFWGAIRASDEKDNNIKEKLTAGINGMRSAIDEKLAAIHEMASTNANNIKHLDERKTQTENKLEGIEKNLGELKNEFSGIKANYENLDKRASNISDKIDILIARGVK